MENVQSFLPVIEPPQQETEDPRVKILPPEEEPWINVGYGVQFRILEGETMNFFYVEFNEKVDRVYIDPYYGDCEVYFEAIPGLLPIPLSPGCSLVHKEDFRFKVQKLAN